MRGISSHTGVRNILLAAFKQVNIYLRPGFTASQTITLPYNSRFHSFKPFSRNLGTICPFQVCHELTLLASSMTASWTLTGSQVFSQDMSSTPTIRLTALTDNNENLLYSVKFRTAPTATGLVSTGAIFVVWTCELFLLSRVL